MILKNLQENWNEMGKRDPLYFIATFEEKKGGKWNLEEFFRSGKEEINKLFYQIENLNLDVKRERALDFGCGVGRVTRALSYYFDEVVGVDIAESMIRLAKRYNKDLTGCRFFMNEQKSLSFFGSNRFDFIYSNLVFQHMEPCYTKGYLIELLRILKPQGYLVFSIPGFPSDFWGNVTSRVVRMTPIKFLNFYRKIKFGKHPIMEIYRMEDHEVRSILKANKAKVIATRKTSSFGRRQDPSNIRYFVRKTNPNL